MAHNIYLNPSTNKHSFFSRKELAWHGLGQILNQDIVTAREAMIAGGANFEVRKARAYAELENGMFLPSDNHYLTYRTDINKILGQVGEDYEVVQNIEAFDFIDNIIIGKEATFETAGVLGNGARIFVTAKLPSYVKLGGNDVIDKYIVFTTTHDGTGKIIAAITPIRVVCNNTLQMALTGCQHKIAFKHTRKVHDRIAMAHKLMGLTNKYYEQFEELMLHLRGLPMGKENVVPATCKIFLSPADYNAAKEVNFKFSDSEKLSTRKTNIITTVLQCVEDGVGQDMHRGTALWLMNGITTYYQNNKEFRTSESKFDFLTDTKYTDLLTHGTNVLLTQSY